MTSTTKRVGSLGLVLIQLWSAAVFAQAACPATSSLGSVFSTLPGGSITFSGDAGGECNITFYGNTEVNTGNLAQPGSSSGRTCKSFLTQQEATSNATTNHLTSSGSTRTGPALTAYSESPETLILEAYTNSLSYRTSSSGANNTVNFINGEGTIITASGESVVVKLVGSENGAHSYTLPGGDYGEITWQNMNTGQFKGFTFNGPIRATYIHGGNCSDTSPGNGIPSGFGVGLSFAQDVVTAEPYYRQQNYINRMQVGDGCALNVAGPGRTTINILGKERVASTSVTGFKLGQSNSCVNFTYAECLHDPKSWADMESQHPERLQFNLYNGDFENSDRLSFAAGVYVPNGDFKMTAASGTSIVGEVLARSVYNTQNNSGSQFFSKSTAITTLQTAAYSLTPPVTAGSVVNTGDFVYRAMQNDYRADGITPGTSGHLKAFTLNADSTHSTDPAWDAAALMTAEQRAALIKTETDSWAASNVDFQTLGNEGACVLDPRRSSCREANDPRDPASLLGVPWRVVPIVVGNSVIFATDDGVLYSVNKLTGALNWGWIPRAILTMANTTGAAVTLATRHPWGQINGMAVVKADSNGVQATKTYVTGTALGGQLHFSIEVSADASSLERVAWIDMVNDEYSPGSLVPYMDNRSGNENSWPGVVGRPYGGAAPTGNLEGDGRVAYVRGNKLFIREVDGSGATPSGVTFTSGSEVPVAGSTSAVPTVTSNLAYRDDSAIYFGAGDGKVYSSASTGALGSLSAGVAGVALGSDPVWYVNTTRLVSSTGSAMMLMAQTKRRVNMLRFTNDEWSLVWWTGFTTTGTGESSATAVEKIAAASSDNAYLSAPASITKGGVVLYYTTKPSSCVSNAYAFGPLKLEDGSSAISNSQFKLDTMTSLTNRIGDGEATGGTQVRINGKDGVLTGSSGTSTSTGQTASITRSSGSTHQRLNWRELTNFF